MPLPCCGSGATSSPFAWSEAVLDLGARREFFQLWPGSFPLIEQDRP